MNKRKAVIIYYDDDKFLARLDKRLVNVYYASKKMKYAYVYFDSARERQVMDHLKRFKEVSEIADSLFDCEKIVI